MVTYMLKLYGTITMKNQIVLQEANDQGNQNDDFYNSAILLFGMAATGILALFQTGSTFRFYWLTRHMKEVGWMLHVINILTIISGISMSYIYWLRYD